MRRALRLGFLIAFLGAAPGSAGEPAVLGADELVAALRQGGEVGPAIVDDDIDLARLPVPADTASPAIVLRDVRFRGRVRGAPGVKLSMAGGSICRLDAEGAAFTRTVDLRGVAVGAARLPRARLDADWTCFECRVCRANFAAAEFRGGATFTGSTFGAPPDAGLCRGLAPSSCDAADFAEARFAGPARFDRSDFRAGASFDLAEFRDGARFARVAASAPVSFLGARFRGDAEFRDCALADTYFGPNVRSPAIIATTVFAARADFRRCRFTGSVRFDNAVFAGDALFAGARFSGPVVSLRGALPSHSLDLRGVRMRRADAEIRLDAAAADAIRLDWGGLGPYVLRGLPSDQRAAALDTLSHRLADSGESRASLAVGFEAKRARRQRQELCDTASDSIAGCAATEAEWWLWTWPTRNGSDLTLPVAALALLWLGTAAVALPRGHVLVTPSRRENAEPIYDCLPAPDYPDGAYCPLGLRRTGEAVGFAAGIVFKLGSRRQRLAAPASGGRRLAAEWALRAVWLSGWAMIGLAAGVVAASFPGLRALAP